MRVLVVVAHPDDAEEKCGGTLAKMRARGDEVIICHASSGSLGHEVITPDELRPIRHREAVAAGAVIGAEVIWGGFDDLEVYDGNREARDKMVDVIRYADPDVIFTHYPHDYMPDHEAVSRLVFDASFTATLPNYHTAKTSNAVKLVPIYYMMPDAGVAFTPTEYVDISAYMDKKIEMLSQYESQIVWLRDHDGVDFTEMVRTTSRFYGFQCGVDYAEGFCQCQVYLKGTTKRLLP